MRCFCHAKKQPLISQQFLRVASRLLPLTNKAAILDLGCGEGKIVRELRQGGYDAYGCDFIDMKGVSDFTSDIKNSYEEGVLRTIDASPYRLPFHDNTFDYIFSSQVFEHVMDYDTTLKEIYRILKPGGLSLNMFPGRYIFIEPHVLVPMASVIQNKLWLLFWAYLGVRNRFQRDKSAREVVALNYDYLKSHTNYLTKKQILSYAKRYFAASFREDVYVEMGTSGKAKIAKLIWKLFPWLPVFLSEFHTRVLVLRK